MRFFAVVEAVVVALRVHPVEQVLERLLCQRNGLDLHVALEDARAVLGDGIVRLY